MPFSVSTLASRRAKCCRHGLPTSVFNAPAATNDSCFICLFFLDGILLVSYVLFHSDLCHVPNSLRVKARLGVPMRPQSRMPDRKSNLLSVASTNLVDSRLDSPRAPASAGIRWKAISLPNAISACWAAELAGLISCC